MENNKNYFKEPNVLSDILETLKKEILLSIRCAHPKSSILPAFNVEYKVRDYIKKICEFVVKNNNFDYWLDQEFSRPIIGRDEKYQKQFYNQKNQNPFKFNWKNTNVALSNRPDFEIKHDSSNESICILEAKKIFKYHNCIDRIFLNENLI